MIYALVYRCLKICSGLTKFHEEFNFWKHVFLKIEYPLSFIDKCFKMVINKLVIKRTQVTTGEDKTLILSLPYLGEISLQTRTNLRKSFKGIINYCKFQIVFKSQRKPILEYGYQKHILEIKESLLIKRDRPVLNKNISSAILFLFYNN